MTLEEYNWWVEFDCKATADYIKVLEEFKVILEEGIVRE